MCGVTGFWGFERLSQKEECLRAMTTTISHRGPDGVGYWSDAENNIFMGHRRLSVVDITTNGQQPMHSPDGRYTIVFNGEIYNHRKLRRELEIAGKAPQWQSETDTEVLLSLIVNYGVKAALEKSNGMFAFALFDNVERSLTFARDRMGEKPLYVSSSPEGIVFGSELKAVMAHPGARKDLNRSSLHSYFLRGYATGRDAIIEGVTKVPAGHFAVVRHWTDEVRPEPYWQLSTVDPSTYAVRDSAAVTDELETLLRDVIADQMIADVNLGAFLSGGIDSSLVVAIMQSLTDNPVHTFSIGFNSEDYNEANHAKRVAEHLGTDHTELYFSEQELLEFVPKLSDIYCEPFADSSQLPTLLASDVSKASASTRKRVGSMISNTSSRASTT